jgi:uncharacterized delta-60 repeat protein
MTLARAFPRRGVFAAIVATTIAVVTAGLVPAGAASPPEGAADPGFGDGGIVTTDFAAGWDQANALALQPDGKIVVAGSTVQGDSGDFAIARYNPNGSPDTSFGTGGKVTTDFGKSDFAYGVALQADGKIVAVGTTADVLTGASDFALARYNANGSLDTSFGGTGKVITDIAGGNDQANAVAVQPDDGQILVAGFTKAATNDFAVLRYNPNGSLDPTFGGTGKVTTDFAGGDDIATAMALQPDGGIVVAGFGAGYEVARYNPNGSLDTTFNGDGTVVTTVGNGGRGEAVTIQPDGKIVVAGYSFVIPGDAVVVVRYNADGSFDTQTTTRFADLGNSYGYSVAIQPDGRIVAAGGTNHDIDVLRETPSGNLDYGFGVYGKAGIPMLPGDGAHAMAIQPDGKIVAAGSNYNGTDADFGVVRFIGDATAPYGGHMIGLPANSTTLAQPLQWIAMDDNTGVKNFDVRMRNALYNQAAYGVYSSFKTATPLSGGTFTATPGRTVCFGVRATDMANNVGVYGPDGCVAYPVDDPTATPTGTWTAISDSHYYGGTARSSSIAGATLSVPVAYRHLGVVVKKCVGCGTFKVFLGNVLLKTIATSASSTSYKTIIPIDASVAVKSGTVVIQQASAGKPVTIDGIAVSLN